MIAAIACLCGVLSKEFVAVTPLIVLLYDRVFAFRSFREGFAVRRGLYGALAATWIPLGAILALRPHSTIGFAAGVDPWTYLLNQAEMIGRYLRQAVWPDALGTRLWRAAPTDAGRRMGERGPDRDPLCCFPGRAVPLATGRLPLRRVLHPARSDIERHPDCH